jgi:biopolymer transport protein ExbD
MKSRRTTMSTDISFTPLVDVMFNLIIFILLTASFINMPPTIPVHLPEAGTAEAHPEQEMVIVVTTEAENNIFVNGKVTPVEELLGILQEYHERTGKTTVKLEADELVNHGTVVKIVDISRQAELRDILIATKRGPMQKVPVEK